MIRYDTVCLFIKRFLCLSGLSPAHMIQNQIVKKTTSHPISRFFRPMFEKKSIKSILGGFFSVTSLASGIFLLQGDKSLIEASFTPVSEDVILETKLSISKVVPSMSGVSQEFHLGHPGIDITAPLGSKILPFRKGKVIMIGVTGTGYGRYVEVDHGDNIKTLYAHMGKIQVEEGDVVDVDRALGEVGLTGRTTGPHLHLEVIVGGKHINPRTYILSLPKGPRK